MSAMGEQFVNDINATFKKEAEALADAVRVFEGRFCGGIKTTDGPHPDLVMLGCGGLQPEGGYPPGVAFSYADAVKLWAYGAHTYADSVWSAWHNANRRNRPANAPGRVWVARGTLLWRIKPSVEHFTVYHQSYAERPEGSLVPMCLYKVYSRLAIIGMHWGAIDFPVETEESVDKATRNEALLSAIGKL